MVSWGSNSVIYNLFTCDVNFPLWRHYLGCQWDSINVKNFHEILRYLFQILATPLYKHLIFAVYFRLVKITAILSSQSLYFYLDFFCLLCIIQCPIKSNEEFHVQLPYKSDVIKKSFSWWISFLLSFYSGLANMHNI